MPENVSSCPLCGHTHSLLFDQRRFRGQAVANRICTRCGLVFQSPRMTDAERASFYEREYRQVYQGREGPDSKDLLVQRGRAQALLEFTRPGLPVLARHLDIGCSAGLLLQAFQKAYRNQAVGVEPGEAYRAYAQKQGLKVYPSLEALLANGEERFDLISLAHVLEHLPDPVAYLNALRENLLAPTGSLLLEVPNLYAHDSFEIAHLVSYTPHTLGQTLCQAGFEIQQAATHGRPRSNLLPLYTTLLARPRSGAAACPALKPENGVRLKRKFGMLRRRLLTRFFPTQAWLPL